MKHSGFDDISIFWLLSLPEDNGENIQFIVFDTNFLGLSHYRCYKHRKNNHKGVGNRHWTEKIIIILWSLPLQFLHYLALCSQPTRRYVYSANDRENSKGSLHYKSRAWDFRNFMNNDPKSERHPKIEREKVTEALVKENGCIQVKVRAHTLK